MTGLVICKFFGHRWDGGHKRTSVDPGELGCGGLPASYGCPDTRIVLTCLRCGYEDSSIHWEKNTLGKGGKMDEQTTERTLQAMEYNVRCKQQIIDKLLAENMALEEKVADLEKKLGIVSDDRCSLFAYSQERGEA
jgi:hypothetical protein